ncbi:unnamed protein product [Rangifer tarandus platyrhynchus]|uniref:Uncharacterized protein n=1 Tax=Rangifer tarandus platyrhynchus TaxID=3082113 RepID=A0AC59Z8F4_RANTA
MRGVWQVSVPPLPGAQRSLCPPQPAETSETRFGGHPTHTALSSPWAPDQGGSPGAADTGAEPLWQLSKANLSAVTAHIRSRVFWHTYFPSFVA